MQEEKAREWEKGTAEPIPFNKYEKFKKDNFKLSNEYKKVDEIARDMLNRLYQNTLKDNWNNINKSYSKFKGLLIGISGIGMFLLNKINNELLDHFLWIE